MGEGRGKRIRMKIGVISDTHGLLRPEAKNALIGVDSIIHAGDIGKPQVIEELESIAPLAIIKGNIDTKPWAETIPDTLSLQFSQHSIFVLHNIKELDFNPSGKFSCVIYGHSHKPHIEQKNTVLYLNPGSAGPRRFKLPICLAMLEISKTKLEAKIVELNPE